MNPSLGSSKRESGQTVIAAVPVSVIAAGPAVPPELSSSPGDSVSSTVPVGPRRARKERTGADRGHPKQEKCPLDAARRARPGAPLPGPVAQGNGSRTVSRVPLSD